MQTIQSDSNANFHTVKEYLSEKEDLLHTAIKKYPNNAIIAGCGFGKSAICFSKKHGKPFYQTYNEKEGKNHYTVYIATTKLKIKMDIEEYPHVTPFYGEMNLQEVERVTQIKKSEEKVIITTYGYVQKVVKYFKDNDIPFTLIFDEYHCLFNQFEMREQKELKILSKQLINCLQLKNKLYLSATLEPSYLLADTNIMYFRKESNLKINCKVIEYNTKKCNQIIENIWEDIRESNSAIYSNLVTEYHEERKRKGLPFNRTVPIEIRDKARRESTLPFLFYNNKEELAKLHSTLNSTRIAVLTSDEKESKYFKRIIKPVDNKSFSDHLEGVFTTSVSEDSLSFQVGRKVEIIYVVKSEDRFCSSSFEQFISRCRDVASLDVTIIIKKKKVSNYTAKSSESINKMINNTFKYYYEAQKEDAKTKYEKRLSKAEAVTKDLPDREKKAHIYALTKDLNIKDGEMYHQWKAGHETWKDVRKDIVGLENIKSELERRFGNNITLDLQLINDDKDAPSTEYNGNSLGNHIQNTHIFNMQKYLYRIMGDAGDLHKFFEDAKKTVDCNNFPLPTSYVTVLTQDIQMHFGSDARYIKKRLKELIEVYDELIDAPYFNSDGDRLRAYLIREKQIEENRKDEEGNDCKKICRLYWIPKLNIINRELGKMQLKYAVNTLIEGDKVNVRELANINKNMNQLKYGDSDVVALAHWKLKIETGTRFVNVKNNKQLKFVADNPQYVNLSETIKELRLEKTLTANARSCLLNTLLYTKSSVDSGVRYYKVITTEEAYSIWLNDKDNIYDSGLPF